MVVPGLHQSPFKDKSTNGYPDATHAADKLESCAARLPHYFDLELPGQEDIMRVE